MHDDGEIMFYLYLMFKRKMIENRPGNKFEAEGKGARKKKR